VVEESQKGVLLAQGGALDGMRWEVNRPLILGRDATSCDVVIPNQQVSRRHARLTPTPHGVLLEDLQSKNGTFRNGEPVTSAYLKDGDTIQLAFAQRFLFVVSDATVPLSDVPMARELLEKSETYALKVNPETRQVWVRGKELIPPLSVAQFRLLWALYREQGKIVSREDLVRAVWGEEAVGVSKQALDALVRRLRSRLAAADPAHSYIITIRGHGLRLDNVKVTPEN